MQEIEGLQCCVLYQDLLEELRQGGHWLFHQLLILAVLLMTLSTWFSRQSDHARRKRLYNVQQLWTWKPWVKFTENAVKDETVCMRCFVQHLIRSLWSQICNVTYRWMIVMSCKWLILHGTTGHWHREMNKICLAFLTHIWH